MVVSETWYLDPIEWRRFREELRHARAAYERMSQLVSDQRDLRLARFKRNSAVRNAPELSTKLLLKTTDIDRYFADIAKVAPCIEFDLAYQEWKRQRNELFKAVEVVKRLLDRKRTKQANTDKRFVRLLRVKKEAMIHHKLMLRLEQREKILMQAIQAGLFLTTAEMEALSGDGNGGFQRLIRKLSQ